MDKSTGLPSYQVKPVWDRELIGFPASELDPRQMYAGQAVYTLSGAGWFHFYAAEHCDFSLKPCISPGRYDVKGRRGMEYNEDEAVLVVNHDLTALVDNDGDGAADSNTLVFTVAHVVDTPGYLMGDFHQHAGDWEEMPKEARVMLDLCWGLDVWAHSAHLNFKYYERTLSDLGLSRSHVCLPSAENDTYVGGHYNILPQYPFLADPDVFGKNHLSADPAKSCDPFCPLDSDTCRRYCPDRGRQAYGWYYPWRNDASPFHVKYRAELYEAVSGDPVFFQVNHPGCPGGFFFLLDQEGRVLENPEALALWRDDFDGLEYRNDEYCPTDLRIYYGLLNQGYHFTLTRNSDSHWLSKYYNRLTYVSSDKSPADNDRRGLINSMVQSLRRGRSIVTDDYFMSVAVKDASGDTVFGDALGMGPLDATSASPYAPSSAITFNLRVQHRLPCEPWLSFAAVVNGSSVMAGSTIAISQTEAFPGFDRCEGSKDVSISFSADSWLIFSLQGGQTLANPIRVERDGQPGISPVHARPEITGLGIMVGNTAVSEANPAMPGDTITLDFYVAGADGHAPRAWIGIGKRYVDAVHPRQLFTGPAACAEIDAPSGHWRCDYAVKGEFPEFDGPENEVRIMVRNLAGYAGWRFDTVYIKFTDTDGDGLPDWWEQHFFGDPVSADSLADPDGDSVTNSDEYHLGANSQFSIQPYRVEGWGAGLGWTRPNDPDTDHDGVSDFQEGVLSNCLNQVSPDTDADGLCDGSTEVYISSTRICRGGEDIDGDGAADTDPCNPDSDGDGMSDGWEVLHSLPPACVLNPLVDDASSDPDGDGITNLQESWWRTSPCSADTDGDGIPDLIEISSFATRPDLADTDGDLLSDLEEISLGLDPRTADTDGDGLDDGDEVNVHGTTATLWDTDSDLIPDLYEVVHWGDVPALDPFYPLDADTGFEPPGQNDGLPNFQEYWNGSDPWSRDPAPGPFDNPACFYWGDADGDGSAQANDVNTLALAIVGLPHSYAGVIPDDGDSQDLDADGALQAGDMNILRGFVAGTGMGLILSRAASLERIYEPSFAVLAGGTTHLSVAVRNSASSGRLYQDGFGVLFSIDPGGSGQAILLGGEGGWGDQDRYDVSAAVGDTSWEISEGIRTIRIKAIAPGDVIINAVVQDCGTPGVGRWCDEVVLDPPFVIEIE